MLAIIHEMEDTMEGCLKDGPTKYVLTVSLIQSQHYSIGHKIKGGHVAEIPLHLPDIVPLATSKGEYSTGSVLYTHACNCSEQRRCFGKYYGKKIVKKSLMNICVQLRMILIQLATSNHHN